jgi:HPt (histidine-containing phosphotransfer) domain-containing protein
MSMSPDAEAEEAAEKTKKMIAAIWARNRPVVGQRLALLDRAAAIQPLPEDLRIEALGEAHKLAGSLGMFGFHDATLAARELEVFLGDPSPEPARLAELVARLHALLARHLTEV